RLSRRRSARRARRGPRAVERRGPARPRHGSRPRGRRGGALTKPGVASRPRLDPHHAEERTMRPALRNTLAVLAITASAAVALGQSTGPLSYPKATQDVFDREMAATWKACLPTIEDLLRTGVASQ